MEVVFVSQFLDGRRTFKVVDNGPGKTLVVPGQSDTAKLLAQDLDAIPAARELSLEPAADQAAPGAPRERKATWDGPPRARTSPTDGTGRGR